MSIQYDMTASEIKFISSIGTFRSGQNDCQYS